MGDTTLHVTIPFGQLTTPTDGGSSKPLLLEILVSDHDSLTELLQKAEGRERSEYAPGWLHGVVSG